MTTNPAEDAATTLCLLTSGANRMPHGTSTSSQPPCADCVRAVTIVGPILIRHGRQVAADNIGRHGAARHPEAYLQWERDMRLATEGEP